MIAKRDPIVLRITLQLVVVALASGCRSPAVTSASVAANFRLWKTTYHVGEPIVVEFTVANVGSATFSFDEGGDYRGTLRSERYSFRVENSEGRVFTMASPGTSGGVGRRIALEPGHRFRSWQLLNAWFHLLPPGQYTVRCQRTVSCDGGAGPEGPPVTARHDLSFTVESYNKRAIRDQIATMQSVDVDAGDVAHLFGVPVSAAIEDLRHKFSIDVPVSSPRSRVREAVLRGLPEQWSDRYYVAYDVTANRNWLTRERPEPFYLTLVARNHGNVALPHRFAQSALSINGTVFPRWVDMVRVAAKRHGLPDSIGPAASASITIALSDVLPPEAEIAVEWTLDDISRRVCVRRGR